LGSPERRAFVHEREGSHRKGNDVLKKSHWRPGGLGRRGLPVTLWVWRNNEPYHPNGRVPRVLPKERKGYHKEFRVSGTSWKKFLELSTQKHQPIKEGSHLWSERDSLKENTGAKISFRLIFQTPFPEGKFASSGIIKSEREQEKLHLGAREKI